MSSNAVRKEEAVPHDKELEALEVELLVEAIYRRYGYDFREYALASFKRRVAGFLHREGLETVSGLQERVLHDPACFQRFLSALSVNVTAFFRDPQFFLAFRQRVTPILRCFRCGERPGHLFGLSSGHGWRCPACTRSPPRSSRRFST